MAPAPTAENNQVQNITPNHLRNNSPRSIASGFPYLHQHQSGHRHRSLVRPERSRSRHTSRSRTREFGIREHDFMDGGDSGFSCWSIWFRIMTCCISGWALSRCGGLKSAPTQAAWREKVTLCIIIFILCLALAFLTYGLTTLVCRPGRQPIYRLGMVKDANTDVNRWFLIHGQIYNIPVAYKPYAHKSFDPYDLFATLDLSPYFPYTPTCQMIGVAAKFRCAVPDINIEYCHSPALLNDLEYVADVAYDWDDIYGTTKFVYNGEVLDIGPYLDQVSVDSYEKPFGPYIDKIFRRVVGGDGSRALAYVDKKLLACIHEHFRTGFLEVKTIGCIVTDIILYVSLVVILSVVLAKFALAAGFAWVMAHRLGKPPPDDEEETESMRKAKSPIERARAGSGGTLKTSRFARAMIRPVPESLTQLSTENLDIDPSRLNSINSRTHMYTILLVTCYSESEAGLRITLDSLAETDYDDSQKLLLVIADGIITGSGNSLSTPDIVINMIERDDPNEIPEPQGYLALADGTKRHNMAQVYSGYYVKGEHRVPIILVVKCGAPVERDKPKPGNRGKRDSQIILMSFLNKVLSDDRMTALEYELFRHIHKITGVFADNYELVLMVDADTKVLPSALTKLAMCMRSDPTIMGLCGETRIANKTASWVSMIQVFEYYISHHQSKAFESVFGGVTCLPGCFCMYRIKAPKPSGLWAPIIASSNIVDMYSENVTDTLHKKNLLLLGEDRYLTTLMLKTFPKRKLMFCPSAICKTMVPEEFSVLLSQRRRWINSTVHNLLELVLVKDLCGTFCCSMQFVIFMELVGTVVLPAAITFTGVLIISSFVSAPQWIPLGLLGAILGLPAVLILFTTRKLIYIFWMLIYMLSLPIWNFVLPVYAYWHFDDFSWGETRKVEGGGKGEHGNAEGAFDSSQIVLKNWYAWEKERRIKKARRRSRAASHASDTSNKFRRDDGNGSNSGSNGNGTDDGGLGRGAGLGSDYADDNSKPPGSPLVNLAASAMDTSAPSRPYRNPTTDPRNGG